MVATIKFSQFSNASLTNTTNRIVGVSAPSGGSNFQVAYPLTWTTAARPTTPPAGTLGYNSNLSQYEYWNGAAWVQFAAGGSGSVGVGSINQLAFYAVTGSAVSGFMNSPSSVLITSAGSIPQWATTLPASLTIPTPNITGIINASNANAGSVGEFISSVVAQASAVPLSSVTATDITSITLTAGDWDVWGNVGVGSTALSVTQAYMWISATAGTVPDGSLYNATFFPTGINLITHSVPMLRFNVTTTTIIYLSTYTAFGSGTVAAFGGIYARRVR